MHHKARLPNSLFGASLRPDNAALAIMILLPFLIFVFLFLALTAQPAQAQTYRVIHTFTGGADGGNPSAGLTADVEGNFYGTASTGGDSRVAARGNLGTVFKLSHTDAGWVFSLLYSFQAGNDGHHPPGRVIFGPDGSLYGVTSDGGGYGCGGVGCGTVFKLSPPAGRSQSGWREEVIYRFSGDDGNRPVGELIFDQAGNIYGVTFAGGTGNCSSTGCGVVYELTPSGGAWTYSLLHSFHYDDGGYPASGVVFDQYGNLYGTASWGGAYDYGVVYQLRPSGSAWTESVVYSFGPTTQNGDGPEASLIVDDAGNLYGSTTWGGRGHGGTVFELTPSYGSWIFKLLYDGSAWAGGPFAPLMLDAAGNLYGTVFGQTRGSVFKLTPSGAGWTYTSLHEFTGDQGGGSPMSNVIEVQGHLRGTTLAGGTPGCAVGYFRGCGVVWEITP